MFILYNSSVLLYGVWLWFGVMVSLFCVFFLYLFVVYGCFILEGGGEFVDGDVVWFIDVDVCGLIVNELLEVLIWEMYVKLGDLVI